MSSNLEIIKKSYQCGKSGDMPGLVADFVPNGIWREMAGGPYGGNYVGAEKILQYVFTPIGLEWEYFACIPDEFYEIGDTAFMLGKYLGRNKATKQEFDARVAHVWKLKDGKITGFEQFTDTKKIWDAKS